jgi:hypothetical protein
MSEYIPHRVREWSQEDLGTIAANAAAVFAVVSRGPTGEPALMSAGVPAGCGQEGSRPEVLLLEPRNTFEARRCAEPAPRRPRRRATGERRAMPCVACRVRGEPALVSRYGKVGQVL